MKLPTVPLLTLVVLVAAEAHAGVPDVVTYAGNLKQGTQNADGSLQAIAVYAALKH